MIGPRCYNPLRCRASLVSIGGSHVHRMAGIPTRSYDRGKLLAGVVLACRKRPISREEMDKLVDSVEVKLGEDCRLEVPSQELGELVLERLSALDPVAYVRFASVYRQFDSPEHFVEELKNLKR